jgi:hypothetical protein
MKAISSNSNPATRVEEMPAAYKPEGGLSSEDVSVETTVNEIES